jgi:hypothetical protein
VELIVNIKLSEKTVNQILGYLGTRPYQEVFTLIETIQREFREQSTPTEEQKAPE